VAVIGYGSVHGSSAAISVVLVVAATSYRDRHLQLDGLKTTNGKAGNKITLYSPGISFNLAASNSTKLISSLSFAAVSSTGNAELSDI